MILMLISRHKMKFWKTVKCSPEDYYSLLDSGTLVTWYSSEGLLSTSWCPSLCLESLKQLDMLHQFIFCIQFIRAEKSPYTSLKRQTFPNNSLTLFVYLSAYFWPLFMNGKSHVCFPSELRSLFAWSWWLVVELQGFSVVDLLIR